MKVFIFNFVRKGGFRGYNIGFDFCIEFYMQRRGRGGGVSNGFQIRG